MSATFIWLTSNVLHAGYRPEFAQPRALLNGYQSVDKHGNGRIGRSEFTACLRYVVHYHEISRRLAVRARAAAVLGATPGVLLREEGLEAFLREICAAIGGTIDSDAAPAAEREEQWVEVSEEYTHTHTSPAGARDNASDTSTNERGPSNPTPIRTS